MQGMESTQLVELIVAAILNWMATQGWKITVPSKPVSPIVISVAAAILGSAVAVWCLELDTSEEIIDVAKVALISVFGASGLHKVRSVTRSVKAAARANGGGE